MKLTIALAVFGMFASVTAQPLSQRLPKDLPAVVVLAFESKYPQARDVTWDAELSEGVFIATFLNGAYFSDAYFDQRGNWIETVTIIDTAGLPEAVRNEVVPQLPSATDFFAANCFEKPHGTYYQVSFHQGRREINLVYSPKGELLGTERYFYAVDSEQN